MGVIGSEAGEAVTVSADSQTVAPLGKLQQATTVVDREVPADDSSMVNRKRQFEIDDKSQRDKAKASSLGAAVRGLCRRHRRWVWTQLEAR